MKEGLDGICGLWLGFVFPCSVARKVKMETKVVCVSNEENGEWSDPIGKVLNGSQAWSFVREAR